MNHFIPLLCTLAVAASFAAALPEKPMRPDPEGWELMPDFSDEFEGKSINTRIWNTTSESWGTWSWDPANVVQKDGKLQIRMIYEPHQRGGEKLFYKSGIVRTHKKTVYGYFEARIKGASKFPGVCPAFWMIGKGPGGRSSEIDFMEIQEVMGNVRQIDCNLHAAIINEQGKKEWVRERRHWTAPWDPRDDFHVYGCESTPEKIRWFIDGKPVLEAENKHWHLPMDVILSMGLRTPLRIHGGSTGEGKVTRPNPKASTPEGFPTVMEVDYVRVWRKTDGTTDPPKSGTNVHESR